MRETYALKNMLNNFVQELYILHDCFVFGLLNLTRKVTKTNKFGNSQML